MKIARDKKLHFTVCLLVAACVAAVEVRVGAGALGACVAGFLSGTACGVGKEYGDYCNPNSKWDNYDLLADALGALVGSSVGLFALLM